MLEVIDADTVRARLPMNACIAAVECAMISISKGTVRLPPRMFMPVSERGDSLAVMAGCLTDQGLYGAKIVSAYPGNRARGLPMVQGSVLLFDAKSGALTVLVDGAEITARRTAAASALATRLLASENARSLGILGCGTQAASHLEAICAVRDIERVLVWGRSADRARAFAGRHNGVRGVEVVAAPEAQAAAHCDVVCVVTASREPVIKGGWLRPGSHVNLVGAHAPDAREADTALIRSASVYVDSLESAFTESGDILIPIKEGAIDRGHVIGEIGALLLRQIPGRRTRQEITVYKSLGVVAQDLVAANAVCSAAPSSNV